MNCLDTMYKSYEFVVIRIGLVRYVRGRCVLWYVEYGFEV